MVLQCVKQSLEPSEKVRDVFTLGQKYWWMVNVCHLPL